MKRIIILDTETTGVDPSLHDIVEVGAILFDLEHACAIESWASLVRCPSNAAEAINRIPAAAVAELEDAHAAEAVLSGLQSAAEWAEAVVAYSAPFDRASPERTAERSGAQPRQSATFQKLSGAVITSSDEA